MKKFLTEKKKKAILVYLILWLLLAIVFVVPVAVAAQDSTYNGSINTPAFGEIVGQYLMNINIRIKGFQENYIENTKTVLGYYTFFYAVVMLIVFLKSKTSDGAYHDIEHGSSDWCEGGEQYKVLSKNSGIILAKKNYLPIDKQGNVNVLIVGRIWCW